jgi:hypothetical protein
MPGKGELPVQANLQTNARFCPAPPFSLATSKKETAAQAQGRRYEEKALPFLTKWAQGNGYAAVEKPWIEYRDLLGRVRYAQPDFLAIGESTDNLIIIEIKLRHTREAFNQLRAYRELIGEIHPNYHIVCLEFCRYFDRSEFPCELLSAIRPHSFTYAATLWEPPVVSGMVN